jgi:hypothetical protein
MRGKRHDCSTQPRAGAKRQFNERDGYPLLRFSLGLSREKETHRKKERCRRPSNQSEAILVARARAPIRAAPPLRTPEREWLSWRRIGSHNPPVQSSRPSYYFAALTRAVAVAACLLLEYVHWWASLASANDLGNDSMSAVRSHKRGRLARELISS